MIIQLTARLVVLPERAWSEVEALSARGEALPSPAGHAAAAASLSVLASIIGAVQEPGQSVGGVVIDVLTAIVGYGGVAAFAALVAPALVRAEGADSSPISRLGSAAALPLCLSGVFNFLPSPFVPLASLTLGALLSLRAAWTLTHSLLGLEGRPRARAAMELTALSALPLVAAILYRAFFTR